jgi:hypothetical protein
MAPTPAQVLKFCQEQWPNDKRFRNMRVPLTADYVDAIREPGHHRVADNLELRVNKGGSRTWR